jgi:hypothetical protein
MLRPEVERGGAPCCARGPRLNSGEVVTQLYPGGWHSSRNRVNSVVFLSERSVKGRSDCGHFDLAD